MIKLLSKLIKLEDFELTKHSLLLKNDTSGTSIHELEKINIDSIDEEFINITLPLRSLGENHNVTLYIYENPISKEDLSKISSKNYKSAIEFIGKVSALEADDEYQYASIELTQYDKFLWKKVCEKYDKAQERVMQLIYQEEQDEF
ncbi:hypothetical protein [Halobacteriovorax sp. HLS]|uniref:hypothetical protein n=1 Tax=Halobacteriovorax sp. HLS TaxID=2234000 RepID=UPI000FD9C803|nr:hypothetical protein [Halobacteriovorax sp. HLS]